MFSGPRRQPGRHKPLTPYQRLMAKPEPAQSMEQCEFKQDSPSTEYSNNSKPYQLHQRTDPIGQDIQHPQTISTYKLSMESNPQSRKQEDTDGTKQSRQFSSVVQKCDSSHNSNWESNLKQTCRSPEHTGYYRPSDICKGTRAADPNCNSDSWNSMDINDQSKRFSISDYSTQKYSGYYSTDSQQDESFPARSSTISCDLIDPREHLMGTHHSQQGFVGLTNTGVSCCVNVLLQTLYMIPEYKDIIMRYGEKSKDISNSVLYELYQVFQKLDSKEKAVRTNLFIQCLKFKRINVEYQMDVEELFRSLMLMIHEEQKYIQVEETNIFAFTTEEHTKCVECSSEITQKVEMLNIPLSLRNPTYDTPYESMEKSLEAFFNEYQLDQDNKCYCDKCEQKTQTTQYCRVVSLPQVLCFQLKRFHFPTNFGKSVKICDSMTFSESCTIPIDEHNGQEDKCTYNLLSVIVHRGTTYFGHYYAYIRHLPKGEWYCFNDETVRKVSWEVVKMSFGSTNYADTQNTYRDETAYLLFYKKAKDSISHAARLKDEMQIQDGGGGRGWLGTAAATTATNTATETQTASPGPPKHGHFVSGEIALQQHSRGFLPDQVLQATDHLVAGDPDSNASWTDTPYLMYQSHHQVTRYTS